MNSATSFMNLPSSQKSVRAFRETSPRSENECTKHRIYFSQEKGSLENRLVYDKHAPPQNFLEYSRPGLIFQCAFLWQVNKSNMRLGLLCLVITVVCLFHINEGKHGIFVLLYDGEVGESK